MILIINKPLKDARNLSDMFYYMGVLAYAATPSDALSEISGIYRAVIIMNPNTLADKRDYVARLRSYVSIPIFALSDTDSSEDKIIFDGVMRRGAYASTILSFIDEYSDRLGITSPGTYKLAGINASVNLYTPMYFNKALPFTKTETMILKTLIITYPRPLEAKEILKYAFKPSRTPELSNIRTHISVMNKKYREIIGRNIISLATGEGYRILTPEFAEV